MESSRIIISR